MITNLAITTVWTTDQERSRDFFTDKLGFEIRDDIEMGEGMRWITVGVPGQPDVMLALMRTTGPGLDPESAEALTTLVSKGVLGAGAFHTDDCRATYEKLRDRGVDFIQEPQERPYGTEAIFRDDSGNWYSLTQRQEGGLDHSKPWG
ncbi:VOC family protein [Streptomyces sp. WMMC500]|uniref:VOC family protein n=1 Tax=Streptomyces sp. WMMC500 TaxID=3015154 RepID=UPI00248CA9F1|nr:VOC family protein [Streptomyces sp. WMMC500]WBB64179.1 VOC family protein [Streptomyces sp. WMMC500]